MPGLYIHIPFCVKKCAYCDFVSFDDRSDMQHYLSRLHEEIELTADSVKHTSFNTIFIGGGTPSLLSGAQLTALMLRLHKHFNIDRECETTIECNPGTLTAQKLEAYREAGINRLSIGLQSASDELLKRIGRIHDFSQFRHSFALARSAVFSNINVDIMYGLPGQDICSYLNTIDILNSFEPEHISSYSLILEPGIRLEQSVLSGKETLPDDDLVADMQQAGIERLQELGYKRYEISNYSKAGYCCRHNINYWQNGEYIGMGLSAHSALRIGGEWTRWQNTASLTEYLRLIKNGLLPGTEQYIVPKSEEMFETIMLGLRMVNGFDINAFNQRFEADFCKQYKAAISRNAELGLLAIRYDRVFLTEKGLDLQNRVLMDFLVDK